MAPQTQEWVALVLVAFAALAVGLQVFRSFLAEPLAKWLLKRGKVKWAMRIYPRFNPKKNASSSSGDCCN